MRAVRVRSRHFNGRQPNGLNKNLISVIQLRDKSSSGGGGELMRGIKIPQQDFALKMPGGLMREGGGLFAGHYGIIYNIVLSCNHQYNVGGKGGLLELGIVLESGMKWNGMELCRIEMEWQNLLELL